ncbi:RDD family protein [Mycobacterium avium subsp. avium 2285 (R)]|nr:RDD family protein [Mycobacterium avium subsp. avium 2285 (R)]
MTPESRSAYPGEKLGLPQRGPGSLAPMGPRLGALMIDWLISYGLAALAMRLGWFSASALATSVLVIWFLLGVVSVRLFGFTPGQLVLRLQVVTVDGRGWSAPAARWCAVCWSGRWCRRCSPTGTAAACRTG